MDDKRVVQDWAELQQCVSRVRAFLTELPSPLPLGSVVKTEDGLIGVVTGVDAPEQIDHPWSYAVCILNTEDPFESETAWYDAGQLEVMHWKSEING